MQMFSKKSFNYFLIVLICFCVQSAEAQSSSAAPAAGNYNKLVWQDEFNNTGLPDSKKWRYDTGFIANHELQYYTHDRNENIIVHNGLLDIVARNDSFILNGHVYPITSARITTQGIKDWTYGRFEIRAKI